MKLATIRESRNDRPRPGSTADDSVPRDADEAVALFDRGMRAMRARDDDAAHRIFGRVCRYAGDDAPPGLLASARACRDFLDPDRSSEQRAETLLGFFRPTVVRLNFDGDERESGA